MKEFKFPKMTPADIEVRVGAGGKDNDDWCTLLLYKNARIDMAYLDSEVGQFNWQREHIIRENIVNGQKVMVNYCRVSIWDEDKNVWVYKEDCGVESYTEPIKGESSDAFKRACFCWGIGRELYTAPKFMRVNLSSAEYNKKGKLATSFTCSKIGYDDNGNINLLEIRDNNGRVRYQLNNNICDLNDAKALVERQTNLAGVIAVWNACSWLQSNKEFISICTAKKKLFTPKTNEPTK